MAYMTIRFELPQEVEQELRERLGDVDRAAKEALLIQSYREGRLSLGQVSMVLKKGTIETQAWLSERGAPLNYSVADLEEDRRTLGRLFPASDR
jgi:predicted HTH domain antitoxin